MYSKYYEEKSVVAERFNRNLKKKVKHMTAVWKNIYFGALEDIVNKCSNTVHRTMKMKLIDVISDSHTAYYKDFNKTDPKI